MTDIEYNKLMRNIEARIKGLNPIAGIFDKENGLEMTIDDAFKDGYIRKAFAAELIEAQAAVGRLIDLKNKKVLCYRVVLLKCVVKICDF